MAWFYFALGTAISWGIGYALSEKVMHQGISPFFFLLVQFSVFVPILLVLNLKTGGIKESMQIFQNGNSALWICFIGAIAAFIIGNIFIMQAINLKNATYANLIELSYPIFTVLFTYIFFKTFHLNFSVIAGGVLIFCGIFLIMLQGKQ